MGQIVQKTPPREGLEWTTRHDQVLDGSIGLEWMNYINIYILIHASMCFYNVLYIYGFMMFYWDAYDFICIWNNLRIRGNSIYGACEVSGIPVSEFR